MTLYGCHSELQAVNTTERGVRCGLAVQAKADFIRVGCNWSQVRAGAVDPGVYDWTIPDDIVTKAAANGLSLLFILWQSPQWANGSTDGLVVPNAGSGVADATWLTWNGRYSTFCADAVTRYKLGGAGNPSNIRIFWELWNEPNLRSFYHNAANNAGPDAAQYSKAANDARAAMLAVDPTARVAYAAGCCWGAVGPNDITAKTMLQRFFTDARLMDAVTIHNYPKGDSTSPDLHDNTGVNNFDDICDMRRLLDANGCGSTKIWQSEVGWSSTAGGGTSTSQALFVKRGLMFADRRLPYAELYVNFLLKDGDGGFNDGLFDVSNVRKPAGDEFVNFRNGLYSPSYGSVGLLQKKGMVTLNTGTGDQAVTGVGFKPKALIVWGTRQNAAGYSNGQFWFLGFSDGFQDRSFQFGADNGASPSVTAAGMCPSFRCFSASTTPTIDFDFTVKSFDGDGFTLTLATAPATGWTLHYLALGGVDITNAVVADISIPGNQAGRYRLSEIGFVPDMMIMGYSPLFLNALIPQAANTSAAVSLGIFAAGVQHSVYPVNLNGRNPTDLQSDYRRGRIITSNGSQLATVGGADLFGLDLNDMAGTPAGNTLASVLAIQGGLWRLVADTQKTTTGNQALTGVGFRPSVMFAFTSQQTSIGTDTSQQRLSVGACDAALVQDAMWAGGVDNVATTSEAVALASGKVLRAATPPSTTVAEAQVASFDADGYTLNWTTADATARRLSVLVGGSSTQLQEQQRSVRVAGGSVL